MTGEVDLVKRNETPPWWQKWLNNEIIKHNLVPTCQCSAYASKLTENHETTTHNSTPNTKMYHEFAYQIYTVHLNYTTSKKKKKKTEQMKLRQQASQNTHRNSVRNPMC